MNNKVIYTIFCGRKKYLQIQVIYINKLLEQQQIDEVHLWAFTDNSEDLNYLKELTTNNKYKIFYPPNPEKHIWFYYYNYYFNNTNDNDIIIKADDDIVYIDTNNFNDFISSINTDSLYFPNIINNDVCAYLQTRHNIHDLFNYDINSIINQKGYTKPLTDWFKDYSKAYKIHSFFLENKDKFKFKSPYIYEFYNRISINFYGIRGSAIKKIYKDIDINNSLFDEDYFGNIPILFESHKINIIMNVVHFQFGPQNCDNVLDFIFLSEYKKLADSV